MQHPLVFVYAIPYKNSILHDAAPSVARQATLLSIAAYIPLSVTWNASELLGPPR